MFRNILFLLAAGCLAGNLFGQKTAAPDSLAKRVSALENEAHFLKNLKITGYVQAQWQKADTAGARIFGGGGLAPNSDNKFSIRRGRLRFQFSQKHFMLVVQPDFTERSIVLRDFFATVTDPWTGDFSLTVGQFFRPVSFEILNPSWARESPDRARFCQTFFADERDIGAKISYKKGPWQLDLAAVNGNAMAAESDSRKDFIGRVSYSKKWAGNQFSAAASTYQGGVRQATRFNYGVSSGRGVLFLNDTLKPIPQFAKRRYFGMDAQFSHDWRLGTTILRGETVFGTQPGTATSSESPKTANGFTGPVYSRPAIGGAFYLIQNLGKSPFQAIAKYDFFDGNRLASGDEIGKPDYNLSAADLWHRTWGLGISYTWQNLLLLAYCDIVKNEASANLPGYSTDLNDSFLTLRAQLRF